MKNAKRNSHEKDQRAAELRAAALRGLSKTVLKGVKGGDGSTTNIYPSDPIC